MDKKQLTEADIISKFILPTIGSAGWNSMTLITNKRNTCQQQHLKYS